MECNIEGRLKGAKRGKKKEKKKGGLKGGAGLEKKNEKGKKGVFKYVT